MKRGAKGDSSERSHERGFIEALTNSAERGEIGRVKALLESGVDINSSDPETGFTALHIAAVSGQKALLDALLEHNRNHGDLDFARLAKEPKRTAWQLAMTHGHFDIAEEIDAEAFKRTSRPPPVKPSP